MKPYLIIPVLLFGCAVFNNIEQKTLSQIEPEALVRSPFGCADNIECYLKLMPKGTSMVKMVQRNMEYSNRIDTLISLNYKKSKILFHKSQINREQLIGGIVTSPEIVMANGTRVGLSREAVTNSIKGFNDTGQEVLTLESGNRKIKFYFNKKGVLTKYTFQGSVN